VSSSFLPHLSLVLGCSYFDWKLVLRSNRRKCVEGGLKSEEVPETDSFSSPSSSHRIGYEFEGYDLVFCCFEKIGWVEEVVDKSKK